MQFSINKPSIALLFIFLVFTIFYTTDIVGRPANCMGSLAVSSVHTEEETQRIIDDEVLPKIFERCSKNIIIVSRSEETTRAIEAVQKRDGNYAEESKDIGLVYVVKYSSQNINDFGDILDGKGNDTIRLGVHSDGLVLACFNALAGTHLVKARRFSNAKCKIR